MGSDLPFSLKTEAPLVERIIMDDPDRTLTVIYDAWTVPGRLDAFSDPGLKGEVLVNGEVPGTGSPHACRSISSRLVEVMGLKIWGSGWHARRGDSRRKGREFWGGACGATWMSGPRNGLLRAKERIQEVFQEIDGVVFRCFQGDRVLWVLSGRKANWPWNQLQETGKGLGT